jgi:hypothetical protein
MGWGGGRRLLGHAVQGRETPLVLDFWLGRYVVCIIPTSCQRLPLLGGHASNCGSGRYSLAGTEPSLVFPHSKLPCDTHPPSYLP